MSSARAAIAAGVIDGFIYVVGGSSDQSWNSRLVHRYAPAKDTWTRRADFPVPVSWARASASGGYLYVYGGFDQNETGGFGDGTVASVYRYDPNKDSWARMADMNQSRYGAANGQSTIDRRIYVAGGRERRETAPLAAFEQYTP